MEGFLVSPEAPIGDGCSMIRSLRSVMATLHVLPRPHTLSDTVLSCEQLNLAAHHTSDPFSFCLKNTSI